MNSSYLTKHYSLENTDSGNASPLDELNQGTIYKEGSANLFFKLFNRSLIQNFRGRNGNNCSQKVTLSSIVIYLRRRVRSPKIIVTKHKKQVNFSLRFWRKKLKVFRNFNIFFIFGWNPQGLSPRSFIFKFPWKLRQILIILHYSIMSTGFTPKLPRT